MQDRPKKKEYPKKGIRGLTVDAEIDGYNQACDDHDKWLPSEEELTKIISEFSIFGDDRTMGIYFVKEVSEELASAIHRRLRG